jgi:polyhydroxybutyrate depolymerase
VPSFRSLGRRALAIAACAAALLPAPRVRAADDAAQASRALSLEVDGRSRTFHLFVPASAPMMNAPLVVVLHGGYGTGVQAESAYHWDDAARRSGFLVAYPDGLGRAWNAGTCCGQPQRENVDDVAFLTAVVHAVVREQHADSRRVFFTGISNGALMSYRMACEALIPIAAIGPVAGTLVTPCPHPQATSVLAIHGLDDRAVPFNGGRGQGAVGEVRSVTSSLNVWVARDRCGPPRGKTASPVTVIRWSCSDGRVLSLVTIAGAGHQWPGAVPPSSAAMAIASVLGLQLSPPSTALDATSTLWTFFAQQVSAESN